MPRPRLLLLLLLAFSPFARGDELDGSVEIPTVAPDGAVTPSPAPAPTPVPDAGVVEYEDETPRPRPLPVAPKAPARFGLEERVRFRRWLTNLCREDAVSPELAERVRISRDKPRSFTRAVNKQGSLVLMLENYAELVQFRDDCEAARKKNAEACVRHGRLPIPGDVKNPRGDDAWLTFGSSQFWTDIRMSRTPAGITPKTDLLSASREQVQLLQEALKKNFFDLRDAADLNGRPGTAAQARKVAGAVRGETTCGTRAISEGTEKARAPAARGSSPTP